MSKRISPAQRLQAEIDEVFAGGEDLAGAIEQVAVLGARLLLQTAIEAEVAAFLGRDRYERAAPSEGCQGWGWRNGYCPTHGEDHRGPGDAATAEGARHHRAVRLPAVRDGGDEDQRAGVAGDRRVEADCSLPMWRPRWSRRSASRPRCRSRRCRGCVREIPRPSSRLWSARRLDDVGAGLPVPGRVAFQVCTPNASG